MGGKECFEQAAAVASAPALFLGFASNALIRGSMACKHCKQGKIGCPALEMFSKGKK